MKLEWLYLLIFICKSSESIFASNCLVPIDMQQVFFQMNKHVVFGAPVLKLSDPCCKSFCTLSCCLLDVCTVCIKVKVSFIDE